MNTSRTLPWWPVLRCPLVAGFGVSTEAGSAPSEAFSHDELQRLVVKSQVGDQVLQASVLVLKLLEPDCVRLRHAAPLRLPAIQGVLGDPVLAGKIRDLLA